MPVVKLPDGKELSFDKEVTVAEVASSIGSGLAKAAIAGKVNGVLVDTSYVINDRADLSIVTMNDPDGLEVIRHSCAHLLAQAVQSVYPEAKVTIGPVIEDGYYYDFSCGKTFTTEDLAVFEKKMLEISKADLKVSRSLMSRDEAVEFFKAKGEDYKVKIIQEIPSNEQLSFYSQGDFIDLCRGPHVPSTGKVKVFKLTKVAGAYWRGDSNNEMLQRIYGTAFATKAELEAYLHRIEEAEKRDHRKLAKKYNLFHIQEEAPGMIFWHPDGWTVYKIIEQYIRDKITVAGYKEVRTPQLVDRTLWEKSGHWAKFRQEMFAFSADERDYAIKPMNCPCHVQIYNQGIKSYRDLPLRLAEFGSCHRHEPSGALHGLMRLRNFVQDDAHIFCTEDQIQSEVSSFMELLFTVYNDFGFNDVKIKLSTRPAERVGSDEIWDKAEQALQLALESSRLDYQLMPGEGAFYGPKIEFSLLDSLGRVWQCGTIQVDFSMPDRLEAEYISEDGSKLRPVMLHRAILGSLERFIGVLIEDTAGSFPVWLAPKQAVVMCITETQAEYCRKIALNLQNRGFRVITDLRNEKIGYKIREQTIARVPYLLVVGDKEVQNRTVAVRTRDGIDLGALSIDEFVGKLEQDVANRGRRSEE